jgi:hypothetical protein
MRRGVAVSGQNSMMAARGKEGTRVCQWPKRLEQVVRHIHARNVGLLASRQISGTRLSCHAHDRWQLGQLRPEQGKAENSEFPLGVIIDDL